MKYSLLNLVRNSFSYHENWQEAWSSPELKKEMIKALEGFDDEIMYDNIGSQMNDIQDDLKSKFDKLL